jgi:hypothetical protein
MVEHGKELNGCVRRERLVWAHPNNSLDRSANSAALIENLDGFGGSSRPVNSGVRFLSSW